MSLLQSAVLALLPVLLLACGSTGPGARPPESSGAKPRAPIPVILDTDIGTDIDDTWALALLLARPEFDLKLVLTDSGNTPLRARVAARFLEASGRSEVPIGVGRHLSDDALPQQEWVEDYPLTAYPGKVYEDGVQALIDQIMQSREPTTLIVIGPAPNIRAALEREPRIAGRARVFAMSGSVDVGYDGKATPDAEYNVKQDVGASQALYQAPWDLAIAPLDTCGTIRLGGTLYQRLLASKKPMIQALLENYRIWARHVDWTQVDPDRSSSVLFDTLAVALAQGTEFYRLETIELAVTDDGFTRRTPGGKPVKTALEWLDREGYEAWLTASLVD